MNTRHKYQHGSLTRRKRIRTEDVWEYRYYETTPEGQRCRRSKIMTARRHWQDRLAYISTFLLQPVASSGRRHQSATRAAAALDHPKHDECLYTSDAGGKAGREQCGGAERIVICELRRCHCLEWGTRMGANSHSGAAKWLRGWI